MQKFYVLFTLTVLCGTLKAQDPCPNNHALDFDGVNDYVQLNNTTLTGNSNFTIEARFYRDPAAPNPTNSRRMFSLGGVLPSGNTRFDVYEVNGQLYFQWNNTPYPADASTPLINDGNWHHLAAVRNGSNFKVYLDGNLVKDQNVTGDLNITTFRLGNSWQSLGKGTFWDGKIDEVRIWNVARTEAEVDPYINCLLPSCNEPNLRAYFKFNQGVAEGNNAGVTSLIDCTANNLNGTLTSAFALTGNFSNWVCGDSLFNISCCPADFSWTSDSCGNVQFNNLTQQPVPPAYTYDWDFDNDGTTDSNTANPSWNFSTSGTYTVCLSLIDASGTVVCVTCKDVNISNVSGPPAIIQCSPDVTLDCGDPYQVPVPDVVNNVCSGQLNIAGSRSDFQFMNDPFPVGITTITWTATNEFGSSTCESTVTVLDNVAPVAICHDVVVALNGSSVTVPPQVINNGSSDNCCPNVTLSFPGSPGGLIFDCINACTPQTVTLLVTDCNGNTSTCTAQVIVVDDEPPFIACPSNQVVNADPGLCMATVSAPPSILVDNCFNLDLSYILTGATTGSQSGPVQNVIFDNGITTCTYIAVDGCGNSATCSFTVTVHCPPDSCTCGGFSNLQFGPTGGKILNVTCDQPFTVPCPVSGTSFDLSGTFMCSDTSCQPSNLVWELQNSGGAILGSGNLGGVNFILPVDGNLIHTPGNYTIYLRGDCGISTCQCTVQMVVPECPEPPGACMDFNDQSLYNWSGFGITGPTIVSPGPSGLTGDYAMYVEDDSGPSLVVNAVDFDGDWLIYNDSCFCFDIRVFDDGTPTADFPMYPVLVIYNHPNTTTNFPNTGYNQAASFVSNFYITENTGWVRICAPLGPCVGGSLPSSGNGVWTLYNPATSCSDWNTLMQNITHVGLKIDYHPNPQEDIYWDNFCFEPCDTKLPEINCDDFSVDASPVSDGNGECCSTVSITNNTGITDLSSLAFSCSGANFTNVVVPAGYTFLQPQAYQLIIRPPGGTFIPAGQVNDLVQFCLDWSGMPWNGTQPNFPVKITVNLNRLTPDSSFEYRVCTDSIFVCGAAACDTTCIAQTLNISTGYDPVTNSLLAPGNSDPLWTTISTPSTSSLTANVPANVIGRYNTSWDSPAGARWISAAPYNNYSQNNCSSGNCTCEPIVYERCFCLCEDDSIHLEFGFWSDDAGEVLLWDDNNSTVITTFYNNCNGIPGVPYNFNNYPLDAAGTYNNPPVQVDTTLFLPKGRYCLQINHWNTSNVAMGVSLEGTVSGLNFEKDTCCASSVGGIVGTKYRDLNCDGKRDFNETDWKYIDPGLSGWTFTLTGNGITATAVSDINGQFYFPNLPPGTYTITETGQPLYEPSDPASGTVTVTVNAFDITEVEFGNCWICDFITPTVSNDTSQNGCCHTFTVDNNKPDYFTYINLSVLDGGSLVTVPQPIAGPGWQMQAFSPSHVLLQPNGSGTIPTGTQQVLDFCLENLTADEQTILVEFYDLGDTVVCRDTIKLNCDACMQAIVDSAYCEGINQYSANICIKAGELLQTPSGSATIIPLGSALLSVDPPNITNPDGSVIVSLPDIAPGDTYCSIPIHINGAAGGETVCFYAVIHDGDITADELDGVCCADTVPICFTLPKCDPCDSTVTYATANQVIFNGDSCCWNITVHNPPNYFIGVNTTITTPGISFSAINNFPPTSGWIVYTAAPYTDIWWEPTLSQGTYVVDGQALSTVCFDGSAPSPWGMTVTWLAEDSTICSDDLVFDCWPDSAECVRLDDYKLDCIDDNTYIFNFDITNISNNPHIDADHIELQQIKPAPPPSDVFDPAILWQPLPYNTSGSFSTLLYGSPGDTICFVIGLHDVNHDSLHLNCCNSDTFCVVLPPCNPQLLGCEENILVDGEFLNTYDPQFQTLTDFWVAYDFSSPSFITYDSCHLNNAAQMKGSQLSGSGIYQKVNFIANHLYAIQLCARHVDPDPSLQPQIRLFVDDGSSTYPTSGCTLPNCELIGYTPVLGTDWAFYTFNWTADNNYTRFILTPWNQSVVPGQEVPSVVRVDGICVDDYGIVLPSRPALKVRAYPNPTTGDLTLAFERTLTTTATLRVFDMLGRQVKTERVPESQLQYELSLNGLPTGVYFVEIDDAEGQLWGQRIVKE